MLNAGIRKQVSEAFAEITAPVKLVVFTQGADGALECEMCAETRGLVEEVAALSDKIAVEVRDFVADAETAKAYGVDKIPAIVPLRDGPEPEDYGIRFYGIPAGYEFTSLIEAILMVSRGHAELSEQTLKELARLDRRVEIQVYITPT